MLCGMFKSWRRMSEFGKYQFFQVFLHLLAAVTAGLHMLSIVAVAGTPDHRCRVPWLENTTSLSWDSEELMSAIPTEADGSLSSCLILNPSTNTSTTCNEWVYNTTYYTHTRTVEWSMVCDRRWMGALVQSAYMFGVFFGAVVCGALGDKYGRKTVFCWSALFQLLISVGIAFVNNYTLYLVALFFYGIVGSAGAFVTGFVLSMELVGPSKRTICGLLFTVLFTSGIMLVPFWASLIPDAFILQLVVGAHSLLIIGHWWLMDESPRWLWSQGRISESVNIVAKGVRLNDGPKFDRAHYISIGRVKADSEEQSAAGLTDLFKTPRLRSRTLNVAFNWFANSITYYGLALGSSKMEGNPFANMFIMGVVEIPAYILVALFLDKAGRRSMNSTFMIIGGAACLLTAVIPQDMTTVMTTTVFFGKFCISGSFSIIFNYSAEIFPTVVRNTGIGFGSMSARLGGMLAPIVSLLDGFDKRIPIVVFASFALVSGFFALFLPETLHQPMPQTIEDGENFGIGDTVFANGCLPRRKEKEYIQAKPI